MVKVNPATLLLWLIIALVLVPVFYALTVVAKRMLPQPADELAAIRLLEMPTPPVAGRDGSDMFWLWDYQVPEADRHRVAQALRKFYDRAELPPSPETAAGNPLLAYPKFPPVPDAGSGVCDLAALSACLGYVRANAADVERTLQSQRDSVAAGMQVAGFDGARYGITPRISSPLPQLSPHRRLVPTYFAQQFVIGRQAAAVDGLCQDMGAWRRLSGDSDQLLLDTVGVAYARQDLVLLATMLAELPADFSLPASCQAALAPATDIELDICPTVKTEFATAKNVISDAQNHPDSWLDGLRTATVDKRRLSGRIALELAVYCEPVAISNARQDRSVQQLQNTGAPACTDFERSVDPLGCQISELYDSGEVSRYADRHTDLAAVISLMRSILWLRQQPGGPEAWPRLLDARPESLGLKRKPAIAADGGSLSIPLLQEWMDTNRQALAIGPAAAH